MFINLNGVGASLDRAAAPENTGGARIFAKFQREG